MDAMPLDPESIHDIYAALKELTTWWENWMPDDAQTQGGQEALDAARQALRKAEGKNPHK